MTFFGSINFFVCSGLLAIPAVVLGLLGRRIKWWGLFSSLVMLGLLLWPHPKQLICLTTFTVCEAILARAHLAFTRKHGRKVVWEKRLAVCLALFPLVLIKLTGLHHPSVFGFIGVSYVTFRAVQVIVEISDGLIKELPLGDYLYFMTFFPVASSGPIDRSRRFTQDANLPLPPADYRRLLSRGLWLLVLGALYKFVGAEFFAQQVAGLGRTGHYVAYMYDYSLQLFFDFAGYSHMAVGMGMLFGIRTPVNFRMPFVAESIKDFWTRWHISLSFWLRDFVFTRVVMALFKHKRDLERTTAANIAYLVNMIVMGLWHGLTGYYVLYGLYHGILMVANDVYERRCPLYRHHGAIWYRIAAIIVTIHLVMFGFLIFSGRLVTV